LKLYEIQKENMDENENIFIEEYSEQILNVLLENIMTHQMNYLIIIKIVLFPLGPE
jgi:hypothetical protein